MAKVLSIRIGTHTAKIAEVQLAGKKVQLFNAFDVELPEGVASNGEILDTQLLAGTLRSAIEHYGIKTKKILYTIASKKIASKEVMIPYVKENKISGLIKMNASDYFPIPNIEDYSLNYSILEKIQTEDGNKQYRLTVMATPNELLENYYLLAEMLQMSVDCIDYAGNSILQVLEKQAEDDIEAIIQFSRDTTVVNIMRGKVLVMQRTVGYSLNTILAAVKESFKLEDEDAYLFVQDNDIAKICDSYQDVSDVMAAIVNSIARIFEFYTSKNREEPITALKYIGDAAIINGMGQFLEQNIGIPTILIDKLKGVDVKNKNFDDFYATNYLANIGCVINPVHIKYISAEAAEKAAKDEANIPYWLLALAGGAAALIIAAVSTFYFLTKSTETNLQEQVAALGDMVTLQQTHELSQASVTQVQGFYELTESNNEGVVRLIMDLEKYQPSSLSITNLVANNGNVTITCDVQGKRGVAAFITAMKELEYVNDVSISGVSEVERELGTYDSFQMTFSLSEIPEDERYVSPDGDTVFDEEQETIDGEDNLLNNDEILDGDGNVVSEDGESGEVQEDSDNEEETTDESEENAENNVEEETESSDSNENTDNSTNGEREDRRPAPQSTPQQGGVI